MEYEFFEMMMDNIIGLDVEEGSDDEDLSSGFNRLRNLIEGFRMHAQFNNSDDSDDSDEAPLDPSLQNPFPDPFGYLTSMIHHNPTDSFRDVSNNEALNLSNLPEFGVHRCCIIPLHVNLSSITHL